jgi:hypothetical protein
VLIGLKKMVSTKHLNDDLNKTNEKQAWHKPVWQQLDNSFTHNKQQRVPSETTFVNGGNTFRFGPS